MSQQQRTSEEIDAYVDGRRAFHASIDVNSNPHPRGVSGGENNQRVAWYDGWYDAKYEPLHKRIDAKYGKKRVVA